MFSIDFRTLSLSVHVMSRLRLENYMYTDAETTSFAPNGISMRSNAWTEAKSASRNLIFMD